MKNNFTDYEDYLKEQLKDPAFAKEYHKLDIWFKVQVFMIKAKIWIAKLLQDCVKKG
jgi:hypothetical protein